MVGDPAGERRDTRVLCDRDGGAIPVDADGHDLDTEPGLRERSISEASSEPAPGEHDDTG